jgi:hypothetical protein
MSSLIRTAVKDDNPAPNDFGPGLFVGYGRMRQTGARWARENHRSPGFRTSETPDFASSFRLREATSGKPGGYVGQAVLEKARTSLGA